MKETRLPTIMVVSQYVSLQKGGAERYIHEVSKRLQRRGVEIRFLCPDPQSRQELFSPIPVFSGGFNPFWSFQLDRALARISPDVVFAHFTVPGITDIAVRRAARMKIPVCLAYHSDVTGQEWYKQVTGRMYYRLMGLKTLKLADRILVCSPKYLEASPWLACLDVPFSFAPYGVDPVMVQGERKPLFPYLFFVGKPDVESKGFSVLYKAWLALQKDFPELGLTAAGAFSRGKNYPGVRFVGQITDRKELADLYASAAVTVLPSTSSAESFGMVLAESLVAGTPVVGSDIGGIPELIVPGENGFLAPPGNIPELARAIEKVLRSGEDLRSKVFSARAIYLERYDWDRTSKIVEQALISCIAQLRNFCPPQ